MGRLIACMSVYNERQFIVRTLHGLLKNGVNDIMVVDGAYHGFPHQGETYASTDGTLEILRAYASERKISLVECPKDGWQGQELKRTVYFRMADRIAEPGDWLVQVDGDEQLLCDGADYKGRRLLDFLAEQPEHKLVCYVAIGNATEYVDERSGKTKGKVYGSFDYWAKVYRWMPELYYGNEHWDILTPEGVRLWDLSLNFTDPRACVWANFKFAHWTDARKEQRKREKSSYENFRANFRREYGCMNPNPTVEVQYDLS